MKPNSSPTINKQKERCQAQSVPSTVLPSDKFIPWYFVLFFLVLFLIDGTFVKLALKSHTGVVTDNAYEKGLNYNQNIEAYKKQQLLGWQSEIMLENNKIIFVLTDAKQKFIKDAEVAAKLIRPTQAGHDHSLTLEFAKQGYQIELPKIQKGLWDVKITAKKGSDIYQTSKRIILNE